MARGGSVRQGGKEELRASLLKTYLLRVRAEKGDRAVKQLLGGVGIPAALVDNETGWVSASAAKRALRAIKDLLGESSLTHRGEWVTHPEALGTLVRMLRIAHEPIDAYRYLADHAREVTRIGTWELEEIESGGSVKIIEGVHMKYRLRTDTDDEVDLADEDLLCAARIGELAGAPRIWGLPEAEITHDTCLAKGGDACVYTVKWQEAHPRNGAPIGAVASAIACGGAVAAAGGWLAGAVAALLGGALGGGVGFMYDRNREERTTRAFEKNRIAALERGLELRGDLDNSKPGDLGGTVLGGKYRILRKLGSGGIGVVYLAEHVTLGHEVAIKVLRGAAARDGGEIARLRREAYIQVHVDNPNVVRVLDMDQMPDGSIYVVMERLVGRSLADKMGREGLVAPGFAIPVFIGVCKGLGAAHRKGVVHRDLKPGNIFLCDDGTPKVLDFGMGKLTSAESLTQAGYTLGTPEYMAPEQCIGAQVEPRTDVYALGVLMYEALTGDLPITAPTRRELLDLHQRQIPKSMRERRPDLPIPEELDRVVMRCLKKKMSDRYRSAFELAEELEQIPRDKLAMQYPPGTSRHAPLPKPQNENAETLQGMPSSAPPPPNDTTS